MSLLKLAETKILSGRVHFYCILIGNVKMYLFTFFIYSYQDSFSGQVCQYREMCGANRKQNMDIVSE